LDDTLDYAFKMEQLIKEVTGGGKHEGEEASGKNI
jgi:hypothetical protein